MQCVCVCVCVCEAEGPIAVLTPWVVTGQSELPDTGVCTVTPGWYKFYDC